MVENEKEAAAVAAALAAGVPARSEVAAAVDVEAVSEAPIAS